MFTNKGNAMKYLIVILMLLSSCVKEEAHDIKKAIKNNVEMNKVEAAMSEAKEAYYKIVYYPTAGNYFAIFYKNGNTGWYLERNDITGIVKAEDGVLNHIDCTHPLKSRYEALKMIKAHKEQRIENLRKVEIIR